MRNLETLVRHSYRDWDQKREPGMFSMNMVLSLPSSLSSSLFYLLSPFFPVFFPSS